jgi:hypothetical protein
MVSPDFGFSQGHRIVSGCWEGHGMVVENLGAHGYLLNHLALNALVSRPELPMSAGTRLIEAVAVEHFPVKLVAGAFGQSLR